MVNTTLISLYILIFLFVVLYLNKDKLKRVFLRFRKSDIKESIKVCPKCKGTDVSPDFSRQTFGEQSEFNTNKCNRCGYRGIFFPEINKAFKNK